MNVNLKNNSIFNHQNLEHWSFNWLVDLLIVPYLYNGILFDNKTKQSNGIDSKVNESQMYHAK